MKKICIPTATRAEFGLLRPIIDQLLKYDDLDIRIIATGTHLSPEFGLTYKEIESYGYSIDRKIEMQLSSDSTVAMSKTMGLSMISFADYFDEIKPDLLISIADRYETLAISSTAMCMRIPIAHLYGGETTEGAIDESIRHAITKMSYIHFTTTEDYRKRVIQLGENPERVFWVGGTGAENIHKMELMTLDELSDNLNFDLHKDYVIITYHPVTLENNSAEDQIKELFKACDSFKNLSFIFTKANADADGRLINKMIDDYVALNPNAIAVESLGTLRYLSAMKYARFVMGNSSSGIMETPSFHIPTIDIGDRQRGRIRADSVINCNPIFEEIESAMKLALTDDFRTRCLRSKNPYDKKDTSIEIARIIHEKVYSYIDLKKKFYDLDF